MPVLSFNPAYPSRQNPIVPEQRRAGLPFRVPGGQGGPAALPSRIIYWPKYKSGGIVPGGQNGGIGNTQTPPSVDRGRGDWFYKNVFAGLSGWASLNFSLTSRKPYVNDAGTRGYKQSGSGLFSWTRNKADHDGAVLTEPPVFYKSNHCGTLHSANNYSTKRFPGLPNEKTVETVRSNEVGRTLSTLQQQSPVQRYLSRWINSTEGPARAVTLPVIPYAAQAKG